MHILDIIVDQKLKEVEALKQCTRLEDLISTDHYQRQCNSYVSRIGGDGEYGVIAEFKRRSPSKPKINLDADLLSVTRGYRDAGAAAISILTDQHFFGGDDVFLTQVREHLPEMPLLRKEFIIDEIQIHQSKALGADLILLIAEILTADQVATFARLARSLGMEVLLEMHSADQLDKYCTDVSVVGVNNRDLTTFEVDYERSRRLYDQLPSDVPKIAESGLSDPTICAMLYDHGFRGFLIGEHFMRTDDPGVACATFISKLKAL